MRTIANWCWRRWWFRWLVYSPAVVIVLLVLVTLATNWYGARELRKVKEELAREGVSLNYWETLPDAIPDEVNFGAIPELKGIHEVIDDDPKLGEPGKKRQILASLEFWSGDPDKPDVSNSASFGLPTDLHKWAAFARKDEMHTDDSDKAAADVVLRWLAPQEPLIHALASGLPRPQAQFTPVLKSINKPGSYPVIPEGGYTSIFFAARGLAFRCVVAARAGDAPKAHESALILSRLTEASYGVSHGMGLLIAATEAERLSNAIWEMCHAHAGSSNEFRALQVQVTGIGVSAASIRAWETELAFGHHRGRHLKNPEIVLGVFTKTQRSFAKIDKDLSHLKGYKPMALYDDAPGPLARKAVALACYLIPTGLVDLNGANVARLQFQYNISPARKGVWPDLPLQEEELQNLAVLRSNPFTSPSMFITTRAVVTFPRMHAKIIYRQCLLNQATVACVLEAFHADNGHYPDSLAGITLADGSPLPGDIVSRQSFGYRKTPNGYYQLWARGFDGKDDDGRRGEDELTRLYSKAGTEEYERSLKRTKFDDLKYEGDWVWDFPSQAK